MIRCTALIVVTPLHSHTRNGDIVLTRQVPRQSQSCKQIPSAIVALTLVVLILVGLQVFLFTQTAATALTLAETQIGKGIEDSARVVEVATRIPAAGIVRSYTQRTIIACLTVAFQDDVDNTSRAFGRKLRTWVVDHLDTFDALCRYLLQDLSTVVTRQSRGLAVDPHLHTRVATQ